MIFNPDIILENVINAPLSSFKLFLLQKGIIVTYKMIHSEWALYDYLEKLAPSNNFDTLIISGTVHPKMSNIKLFMDGRLLRYLALIRQNIEKIPEEITLYYKNGSEIPSVSSPFFRFIEPDIKEPEDNDTAVLFSSESDHVFVAECIKLLEDAGFSYSQSKVISQPEKRNIVSTSGNWLNEKENITTGIVFFEMPSSNIVKLQELTNKEILTRNDLIISIFDKRADGSSGKLKYASALIRKEKNLKRKRAQGLSRLTGGIGLKGPGETKGEERKRILKNKEKTVRKMLKKEFDRLSSQKEFREKKDLKTVAITGYTNAGKSTLFNALLGRKVVIESDTSFSSIDPKIRKADILGQKVLIIDTVGFVTDMSKDITDAFRATFSLISSSLVLHIVDTSSSGWREKKEYIEKLLLENGVDTGSVVNLYSKSDMMKIKHPVKNGFYYSAFNNTDIRKIKDLIVDMLFDDNALKVSKIDS